MKTKLSVILSLVLLATSVTVANAGSRRRTKTLKDTKVSSLKGRFQFGMTRDEVSKLLANEITKRYRKRIRGTKDIYTQDNYRKTRDSEIARIRQSHLDFNGKRTGWDVSIIDDQFRHGLSESMMYIWENENGKNQRRFFFFADGRLYKMVIALNMVGRKKRPSFTHFQVLLEKQYGPGKIAFKEDGNGVERADYVGWKSKSYQVRAHNKLRIHGTVAISIAQKKLLAQVEQRRRDNPLEKKQDNALIEAMAEKPGSDGPDLDANSDAIDQVLRNLDN